MKAQSAGETNEICVSLQGIVELALKHNIKLKSLSREEKAAEAVVEQTRAQRLPLFSVDAKSTHYTGLTSFEIRPMFTIPEIANRYNTGASISQPLYTGGRLRSMRQGAELAMRSVGADQKAAESTAILDSITAYWNWSKAYYQLETLNSAIKRMEAHVKDMQNLKNAGMATENELLSTEVLFEQTKQRYEEALRRLDLVRAWIEFLTGEKTPLNWIPAKPMISTNISVPAEQELIATALKMRNERAAQILRVQAMEEKIKTAESEYYPQVSLVARYEQARPNLMNFPLRDRWQDDAFAGVVVTWNIFDWGLRSAKVREATARRDQTHLALEQLDDQIFYETRAARIKLLDAINRLAVSQRILEKATTNFSVANDLWKNGLARHSDVLDAHAQLTDAQFSGVSDSADIEIAKAQLEYAIGMLSLERIKSVK
ncbi:MAG: TolC family protein [Verrucomicrobiae bacterium]|nr:TolC family protein [Verrucomicrobiae bacterium]